jgi:hypothetical protein
MTMLLKVVLFIMWLMISFSPLPLMLSDNVDKVNGGKVFSNFWIGFVTILGLCFTIVGFVVIFYGAELCNCN